MFLKKFPLVIEMTSFLLNIFAGQLWQDKVGAVRKELMTQKVDAMVVTTLDEIAWLLNVRGSDVVNSPLVEGYVFLSLDRIVLFIQPEKVTGTIREHLNSDRCQEEPICVECVGLIL